MSNKPEWDVGLVVKSLTELYEGSSECCAPSDFFYAVTAELQKAFHAGQESVEIQYDDIEIADQIRKGKLTGFSLGPTSKQPDGFWSSVKGDDAEEKTAADVESEPTEKLSRNNMEAIGTFDEYADKEIAAQDEEAKTAVGAVKLELLGSIQSLWTHVTALEVQNTELEERFSHADKQLAAAMSLYAKVAKLESQIEKLQDGGDRVGDETDSIGDYVYHIKERIKVFWDKITDSESKTERLSRLETRWNKLGKRLELIDGRINRLHSDFYDRATIADKEAIMNLTVGDKKKYSPTF